MQFFQFFQKKESAKILQDLKIFLQLKKRLRPGNYVHCGLNVM